MPALTRTDLELAQALRIAVMRLGRRMRGQRADLNLSLTQLAAVASLDRHGPLTPSALAHHEKVSPPSMSRILAGLEERGLVTRSPHATDGRQQLVAATPTAVAMLREDRRRREAWLAQRLRDLNAEERATLRAAAPILERLGSA